MEAAQNIEQDIEKFDGAIEKMRDAIGQVILGQEEVITHSLTALLSAGHVLLVGLPGLAKTRLVDTLGKVLGLDTRRIQCTPDLMPADILGSEVLDQAPDGSRHFRFVRGPVFCQLLMADEINRASPRTQSALLQAMQEKQVSIAGHSYPLPQPFLVMATQNPLEHEGTYPLPEAQLDRFLMQIDVDYPDRTSEKRMMIMTTSEDEPNIPEVFIPAHLLKAQKLVRRLPVGESVAEAILTLVRNGRPEESPIPQVRHFVSWGPGPRAAQALMLATRARALVDGRLSPSIDDVIELAKPVLQHRMALNFKARAEGITVHDIIKLLCTSISK